MVLWEWKTSPVKLSQRNELKHLCTGFLQAALLGTHSQSQGFRWNSSQSFRDTFNSIWNPVFSPFHLWTRALVLRCCRWCLAHLLRSAILTAVIVTVPVPSFINPNDSPLACFPYTVVHYPLKAKGYKPLYPINWSPRKQAGKCHKFNILVC